MYFHLSWLSAAVLVGLEISELCETLSEVLISISAIGRVKHWANGLGRDSL